MRKDLYKIRLGSRRPGVGGCGASSRTYLGAGGCTGGVFSQFHRPDESNHRGRFARSDGATPPSTPSRTVWPDSRGMELQTGNLPPFPVLPLHPPVNSLRLEGGGSCDCARKRRIRRNLEQEVRSGVPSKTSMSRLCLYCAGEARLGAPFDRLRPCAKLKGADA